MNNDEPPKVGVVELVVLGIMGVVLTVYAVIIYHFVHKYW